MSLFSFSKSVERTGAIVDVGSASVLVAIVASHHGQEKPTIIWSHREHAPLRNIDSLDQSAKAAMTALVNALLKFDVEGRRALYEYNKRSRVDEVQCSIAAPWSYTVTKTINYKQPEEFEISQAILDELQRTATQKIQAELQENETASQLGLSLITRSTMDIQANGYRITTPKGQTATEVSLSQASVLTQQYLIDHIDDLSHKLFHSTPVHKLSYILILHQVVQSIYQAAADACLVNITYEATEIGIVRDGTLQYATHTPFGSFSLAREISDVTSAPLLEAFQSLHTDTPLAFLDQLPNTQKEDVEKIIEAYTVRIADLFHETGDDLSIPKSIFLHVDLKSEPFFRYIIENAAKRRLKSEPVIRLITPTLEQSLGLKDTNQISQDTAMLPSAHFFHTQNQCDNFEYL